MLLIAINMLVGDKVRYLLLLGALAFSTLLMTEQGAIFWGLMKSSTALITNTNMPLWVTDPYTQQVNIVKPMRNTNTDLVKSIDGVKRAIPLSYVTLDAGALGKNAYVSIFFGLDSTSLTGLPPDILQGKKEDLWQSDTVFIDQEGLKTLSKTLEKELTVGDRIEINEHEMKIAGIVKAAPYVYSYPYIYTTREKFLSVIPETRKSLSFILVEPEKGADIDLLKEKIQKETGLVAYTADELSKITITWLLKNTAFPVSFGISILIGFLVGVAISGQIFYGFVSENLKNFAILDAMGTDEITIKKMVYIQAAIAGIIGYGIGLLITVVIGFFLVISNKVPFLLNWQILVIVFLLIMLICFISAFFSLRRIENLDSAEVFRGKK